MLELLHSTRLAYLVELELRKASQAQELRPGWLCCKLESSQAVFFDSLLRSVETTISIINTSNIISNMRLS